MTSSTMNTNEITTSLETIVRRFAPKDRAAIKLNRETRLTDEAGIDSPRMIDLVLAVEDAFAMTVSDDDIDRVKTFGELVDLVESRHPEVA